MRPLCSISSSSLVTMVLLDVGESESVSRVADKDTPSLLNRSLVGYAIVVEVVRRVG